jgi:GTPase
MGFAALNPSYIAPMSLTVAIVGRPNVGKSTLFNRLAGRRVALVDDTPGVTRDRREGEARLGDLTFTIIDTAGLEESSPESLAGRMRAQTETAITDADAVLFLIDARAGVMPDDRVFAKLLRRAGKPTILVANKAEGRNGAAGAYEAFDLGLGEPVAISAEHGDGLADLYDALRAAVPSPHPPTPAAAGTSIYSPPHAGEEKAAFPDDGEDAVRGGKPAAFTPAPEKSIRLAVVGRPNAGKSTLVNRLAGEERLITGPEAGITRDAIAVPLAWHGRHFLVYDTAGLRRRSRIEEKLEKLSVADALEAIRFAEVVILLIDATIAFEDQDLRIADLIEREGRALVLGINKWDLQEAAPGAIGKLRERVDRLLTQVKGVPVVAVSGLTGTGLDHLMKAVTDIHALWNKRIPTGALNRWLDETLAAHPPPAVSGRRLRLNYITQPKTRPPTFVLFCTRADALPDSYRRYLINALREAFGLPGVPIRLTLREKANPYAGRGRRS